jgi:hypothetical protein
MRKGYKISVEKPEGRRSKKLLGRHKVRWEDNIKRTLEERGLAM